MSRRLFRATVDGRAFLVEIDGPNARVGAADEHSPAQLTSDAQTFSIEPFDSVASNVTSTRVREIHTVAERHVVEHAAVERATAERMAVERVAAGNVAGRSLSNDPQIATSSEPQTTVAHHVHTAVDNGVIWTFIDGEVFRIELDDAERSSARTRASAGDEALAAPMPATVIKLLVAPGQTVARGDSLLLLEAMKMELPIRAPRPGRVSVFHCKAGDLVQPGIPLVDLDTP